MQAFFDRQQSPKLIYTLITSFLTAILLFGLWWGNVFNNIRLELNDTYFAPAPTTNNIVIIALDDKSLGRYGNEPSKWSRTAYVDLIDNLIETNPRVLAFDLLFNEVKSEDASFSNTLEELQNNEARTRVVLGTAGEGDHSRIPASNYRILTYQSSLSISNPLAQQADYLGYTDILPDIDSIVRRHTSLIRVEDEIHYSFSIATYLAYLRIPRLAAQQLVTQENDTLFVTPDREVPVDEFGMWRPYFFGPPAANTFPIISLVDVVDGNFDVDLFTDKIVLVGLANDTGTLDAELVPSSDTGSQMPGVEIQANAIESLMQNTFPTSLPGVSQGLLVIVTTLLASAAYARPRWPLKIAILFSSLFGGFLIASFIFSSTFIMINLFDMMLAVTIPFIMSLGIDITVERFHSQQKDFILNSLQQIAKQRLHIEQAGAYILEDVKQLVPDANCELYLYDENHAKGYWVFKQHESSILEQVKMNVIAEEYDDVDAFQTIMGNKTVFPIAWQNKNNGLLIIIHPNRRRLSFANKQLLQRLIDQLAPNIDNMLLYNKLERQKSLLDSVFKESPTSIIVIDNNGHIIRYNETFPSLLNTDDKLRDKSLLTIINDVLDSEQVLAQISMRLIQQEIFHIDELKFGETVVRLDAAPLQEHNLWVVMLSDITAIVELSNVKTQMLRMANHDLKNPLARIMGFAQILERSTQLEERPKTYLDHIIKASREMSKIINDTLDLERLRTSKLQLETTDIVELIRQVCESHRPDTIQKRQSLNLEFPDSPIRSSVDVSRFSQAITNLVGNAIKYTPDEGEITVRLKQNNNTFHFEVEDTGYGIPKDQQKNLFTEFYRAQSAATAHISGTGLGLSLVKSTIEAHGGNINFTSKESVGSTFYFTLPITEIKQKQQ